MATVKFKDDEGNVYTKEFGDEVSPQSLQAIAQENGLQLVESGPAPAGPPPEAAPPPQEYNPNAPPGERGRDPQEDYTALETAGDALASGAVAVPRGAINATIGLPGNLEYLTRAGSEGVQNMMGVAPEDQGWTTRHGTFAPTGQDIESGIESVTGEWYEPKTNVGRAVDFGVQAAVAPGAIGALGKTAQMASKLPRVPQALQGVGKASAAVPASQRAYDAAKLAPAVGLGTYGGGEAADWAGVDRGYGEAAGAVLGPAGAWAANKISRSSPAQLPANKQQASDIKLLRGDRETLSSKGMPENYRVKSFLPSQYSDDTTQMSKAQDIVGKGGKNAQKIIEKQQEGWKQSSAGNLWHASDQGVSAKRAIDQYVSGHVSKTTGPVTARSVLEKIIKDTGLALDKMEDIPPTLDPADFARVKSLATAAKDVGGGSKFSHVIDMVDDLQKQGQDSIPVDVWINRRRDMINVLKGSKSPEHRAAASQIIDTIQDKIEQNIGRGIKTKKGRADAVKKYRETRTRYRDQMRLLDEQNMPGSNRDYFVPERLKSVMETHDPAGFSRRKYSDGFEQHVDASARVLKQIEGTQLKDDGFLKAMGVTLGTSSVGGSVGALAGAPVFGAAVGLGAGAAERAVGPASRAGAYVRNMGRKVSPLSRANENLKWLQNTLRTSGYPQSKIENVIRKLPGNIKRDQARKIAKAILEGRLPEEKVNWLMGGNPLVGQAAAGDE